MTGFPRRETVKTVVAYAAISVATLIIYLQVMNYNLVRESYDDLRVAFRSPYPGYLVPTFVGTTVDGDGITVGERPDGRQLLYIFSPTGEFSVASAAAWRDLASSVAEEHPDVQVVGIDRDGDGAAANFRDEHGFSFPVTTFPTPKLAMLYRVQSTPLVVYLDRQGEVLYSRAGVLTDPVAIDSVAVAVRDLVGRGGLAGAEEGEPGVVTLLNR